MKLFVVGSINMDLVIRAPFMPENGMTIKGDSFMTNPGGKGANQAVAIQNLGGNAYMVGAVGKEFGAELIDTLNSYGVNTEFVEKLDNVSSGIAVITVIDNDNRIILSEGANGLVSKKMIDKALETAESGDYLITQLEIPTEIVLYALKKGKERGMVTVLNPAPAKLLPEEIFNYVDYFTPNQTETEFYTKILPTTLENALDCAKILKEKGIKNIIITMGKDGSFAYSNNKTYSAPCFKVSAVDTTAAGDTFIGALCTALSENMSLQDSMIFGAKASSITVTRIGAQQSIPKRKEIKL